MRVITAAQQVTLDKAEAEKEAKVEVLAANLSRQTAKLAQKGKYRDARLNNFAYAQVLNRFVCASAFPSASSLSLMRFLLPFLISCSVVLPKMNVLRWLCKMSLTMFPTSLVLSFSNNNPNPWI
jgi:hypothetical protein